MTLLLVKHERRACLGLAALAFLSSVLAGGWALGAGSIIVSQRGRAFLPGEVSIIKGDSLRIVNDDGDLLHHAYIESDTFNFDSGDQEPGSKTDVVFTTAGDFKVLCGIHPKMKLLVHVK